MARTYRRRDPGLVKAIKRNAHIDTTVQAYRSSDYINRFSRHNAAILRGQDGAIQMDKCQTASIDSEGGFKLNGHDYIYRKSKVKEPHRKLRQAGKNLIRRHLEN